MEDKHTRTTSQPLKKPHWKLELKTANSGNWPLIHHHYYHQPPPSSSSSSMASSSSLSRPLESCHGSSYSNLKISRSEIIFGALWLRDAGWGGLRLAVSAADHFSPGHFHWQEGFFLCKKFGVEGKEGYQNGDTKGGRHKRDTRDEGERGGIELKRYTGRKQLVVRGLDIASGWRFLIHADRTWKLEEFVAL